MSPLFAALPPGDLPSVAYVAPTGVHATAPIAVLPTAGGTTHVVAPGDTVYDLAERYDVTPSAILRANSLSDGGRWIMPGEKLRIPGTDRATAPTPSGGDSGTKARKAAPAKAGGGTVTVRPGDTLTHLAARHGVSVEQLVDANSISNSRLIYPGQVLHLTGSGDRSTGPRRDPAPTAKQSTSSTSSSTSGTVTVRSGDTLYDLAARHGVSVASIARANDLQDTRLIYPGQKLRLSGSAPAADRPAPKADRSASRSTTLDRPYDEHTIGDHRAGEKVPDTFLHYRYSDGIARSAAANRDYLTSIEVPDREAMRDLIVRTSKRHGVDPTLMLALSYQESGWNQRAVSPANAIGAMQVIPSSGEWASGLVGRELNLLQPEDNVTAGVVIMRTLLRSADSTDAAIGGYYQGLASVRQYGLFPDTRQYVANIKHFRTTL
ncbi:LysM peptidoglycan-binding domain-containing protein [Serinicoccus kebangsaanensis]|uniref:LysM peptidoglycan-binding domain-containing protein n=1 Tax=Serinicoccus kebangsaanensis TaxID=2602069 RepID=UPI00124E16B0|nr:LysM peptidoglycan-binding domain-containing protein [Serinicoccus kebangsaanensis]